MSSILRALAALEDTLRTLRTEVEAYSASLAEGKEASQPRSRVQPREGDGGALPPNRARRAEGMKNDQPAPHEAPSRGDPPGPLTAGKPTPHPPPDAAEPFAFPGAPAMPTMITHEPLPRRGLHSVARTHNDAHLVQQACVALGNISRKAVAGLLNIHPKLLWRVGQDSLPVEVRKNLQKLVEGGKTWRDPPRDTPSGIWIRFDPAGGDRDDLE